MKPRIANRMNRVAESATMKLNALVQTMKSEGKDVLNFSAGEPDFTVHPKIKAAFIQAIQEDRSKYSPAPGILTLRNAVAAKTNRQQPDLAEAWESSHVVVSNGGKQALMNAFTVLLQEGDEVLIPAPYWVSYPDMAKLVGADPKFISASAASDYKITPSQLKEALNAKSRVLVLNSPSNPTGSMYTRDELAALGKVIEQHNAQADEPLVVVSDEIYDRIVFEGASFSSFLDACPQLQSCTVTVNGMSKAFAMTGWRVGWSVAPLEITKAMIKFQGQSTSGINTAVQWASLVGLELDESEFTEQVAAYQRRRDLIIDQFLDFEKANVVTPRGAFYAFIDFGDAFLSGENSIGFCERLLEKTGVALVPGTPFGDDRGARMSFAVDEASIREGCTRIGQFLQSQ